RDGGGRLLREHLSSGGRQQPAPGRAQPAARRRLHREAGRRLSIPLRGPRRARHLRPGDRADRRDAGPAHRDPLVPPLRAHAGTGRRARAEARPALLTVRGAVLAGGAARRYGGRPKGLIELEGRRILDRVVEAVQAATGAPPLVVANAADGPAWRPDLRTIPDVRPGHGSLGGIHTAVVSGPGPVLCVAWDMPFVSSGLLAAPAVALRQERDGRRGVEPLCAVYGPPCGP